MPPPIHHITAEDGVRLAVARHGTGPPIVWVRAWVTHLELQWDDPPFRTFMERLGTQFTVIRYDGRGNGLAEREVPPPVLDDLVVDLEAVMDTEGLDRAHLWGSSFGGPVAIAYAARHPHRVDHLVLEGTFATLDGVRTPRDEQSQRGVISLLDTAPDVAVTALSYLTDPEPSTRHEARVQRTLAAIDPRMLRRLYGLAGHVDVRPLLGALPVPTLVLCRPASRTFPPEASHRLAEAIAGAELVELHGAHHNPWEGDMEPVLSALARFLGAPEVPSWRAPRAPRMALLFTDLVGSTELTGRIGDDAAQVLLREHDRIVTAAVEEHGGRVVKHTGDGFLASFPSAEAGVAAASSIRHRLAARNARFEVPIVVRQGLALGEPVTERGDLFGAVVQLANRVCSAAGGEEILVTEAVAAELASSWTLEPRGPHRLKGFAEPVSLCAVV